MTMLDKDRIQPLAEFVVCTRDDFDNEKYAQAWALTHFFATTQKGRLKKRFLAYVKLIIQSRGSAKTFKKAFKCEPSKFDEDFRKYLQGLKER